MTSFFDEKKEGLFDPRKRYAFTNITTEKFTSRLGGVPVIIEPGQTVELKQHEAVKYVTELVDKIMIGDAKLDELANSDKPYYRSPKGSNLGVPAARKVWEDKIVREMTEDEESPELATIRNKMRDELLQDMDKKEGVRYEPTGISEIGTREEKKAEPKPMKMKTLKHEAIHATGSEK